MSSGNRQVLDLTALYIIATTRLVKNYILAAASVEDTPMLSVDQLIFEILQDKLKAHGNANTSTVVCKAIGFTREQLQDALNWKVLEQTSEIFQESYSAVTGGETLDFSDHYIQRLEDAKDCKQSFSDFVRNIVSNDPELKDFSVCVIEGILNVLIPESHEGMEGQLVLKKQRTKRRRVTKTPIEFCQNYKLPKREFKKWWNSEIENGNKRRLIDRAESTSTEDIMKVLMKKGLQKKRKIEFERICYVKFHLKN